MLCELIAMSCGLVVVFRDMISHELRAQMNALMIETHPLAFRNARVRNKYLHQRYPLAT
jgi:hypothetical protein